MGALAGSKCVGNVYSWVPGLVCVSVCLCGCGCVSCVCLVVARLTACRSACGSPSPAFAFGRSSPGRSGGVRVCVLCGSSGLFGGCPPDCLSAGLRVPLALWRAPPGWRGWRQVGYRHPRSDAPPTGHRRPERWARRWPRTGRHRKGRQCVWFREWAWGHGSRRGP